MKRKHIYLIIAIVILLALFFPFKWTTHEDGTSEYSALAVKYVSWNYTKYVGNDTVKTSTMKVYFFPENMNDYQTLRDEFFNSRV